MLSDRLVKGVSGEEGQKDDCLCCQAGREAVHLDSERKRRFVVGEK